MYVDVFMFHIGQQVLYLFGVIMNAEGEPRYVKTGTHSVGVAGFCELSKFQQAKRKAGVPEQLCCQLNGCLTDMSVQRKHKESIRYKASIRENLPGD